MYIKPDDNNTIYIKAKLTKRGSLILASGGLNFTITKFAVADDEIDYNLLSLDNSSSYYPLFLPVLNGNLFMRNRLYTQSLQLVPPFLLTVSVPNWDLSGVNIHPGEIGYQLNIIPLTVGLGGTGLTYTVTFSFGLSGIPWSSISKYNSSGIVLSIIFLNERQITMSGVSKILVIKKALTNDVFVTLIILGLRSGVRASYLIKVSKTQSASSSTV